MTDWKINNFSSAAGMFGVDMHGNLKGLRSWWEEICWEGHCKASLGKNFETKHLQPLEAL